MRFVLINYSVIVTFIWVASGGVVYFQDLSDKCTGGREFHTYLTTGKEYSDYSIALIANEVLLNCTLMYTVKNGSYVMLVVEFLDWRPSKKVCTHKGNIVFVASDSKTYDICSKLSKSSAHIYRHIFENKGIVGIAGSDLNTIKITATSMRYPIKPRCKLRTETECIYDDELYCMTYVTMCDTNFNCGVIDRYDEESNVCTVSVFTTVVIVHTIIMVVISILLVVAFSIVVIPKRKETFIYKLDESMALFDEGNQDHFEIHTYSVYPRELAWQRQKIREDDDEELMRNATVARFE